MSELAPGVLRVYYGVNNEAKLIQSNIVTWADGTDVEIATMLDMHYNNLIDIHDYWSVGDERTVSLSAMSATSVGESHVAQTVTMVLMNEGGKTLTTPINGHTECAFIVGQKNILANGTTGEYGYINNDNGTTGGWDSCSRRKWCNNVYKNALPSYLAGIFKQHQNITSRGSSGQSTATTSNDYFALPSEKEVFGTTKYANATAETNNTQFEYYQTAANRIKNVGNSGSSCNWWERSPYGSAYFCIVSGDGSSTISGSAAELGIAPFGVI